MAKTTQHDSEHWGAVCVCVVGWQRVVVRGVVAFVLKDGMEQRDGGGVRGFVWSFCRALVVVVVVKQPVCFCVCVWPWQGAGGVLGLLLGTGGGGAQQRLFCGVLWCSVVRWEKTTRPFLRTREFWWQEGHTIHETEAEARKETLDILDLYEKLLTEYLCMPVIKGRKTDKEKFAGAEETYTVEAMMHDGKALQSGTSHYFGDGFAKAFSIQFADRNNKLCYPHQTSWGISTRLIGGIIMTHGDNSGLVLPPAIAPIQVVIVPVAMHKGGVLEKAAELEKRLKAAGIRAKLDASEQTPGWKYAEYEMKGVPIRLEIGPRDIENGSCVLVRRDNREKTVCALDSLETAIPEMLCEFGKAIYKKAKDNLENNIVEAHSLEEMKAAIEGKARFVKAMWCGDEECENIIKEQTGMPSRCIPFEQEHISDVCPVCGKPAKHMVVFGISY